jgi:hypothetical protein
LTSFWLAEGTVCSASLSLSLPLAPFSLQIREEGKKNIQPQFMSSFFNADCQDDKHSA